MPDLNEVTPAVLEHAGAGADGDQYTDSTAITLNVESIIVADRYRKDVGDVSDLVKSIADIGLLNPITVRPWHGGFRLVAGERRLTAFKSMGLAEIPARVALDIADARDALVAERDENTARKEMLPSEATALGIAIQEMEAPAAKERQGTRTDIVFPGTQSGIEPDKWGHKTRDIAAEAIGMSPATFTRMKTLVTVAADESEPDEVREAANDAVQAIDQGAPVRSGYETVKEVRRNAKTATNGSARKQRDNETKTWLAQLVRTYPAAAPAFEAEAHKHYAHLYTFTEAVRRTGLSWEYDGNEWGIRTRQSIDIFNRSSTGIEVAIDAITERVDLRTLTPEIAADALERIDMAALNRIIRKLKEISNV